MGKFCGLGSVGFPDGLLKCRQISGFPLMPDLHGYPNTEPNHHLSPHYNPQSTS